jgi:alcohol oxidase
MMYTRASASDYDDWERVHGNAGWGSEDLIPLLKKVRLFAPPDLGDYPYPYPFLGKTTYHPFASQTETYQIAGGSPTHGSDGPLKVSLGVTTLDFGDQYLQAAAALDPARSRAQPYTDTNDLSTINVYTVGGLVFHCASHTAPHR